MNIIEAIKSGKKYRRKGFHSWCHPLTEKNNYHFSLEDLLADDWEVEEAAVSITRNAYFKAYEEALQVVYINNIDYHQIGALVSLMARKLGL